MEGVSVGSRDGDSLDSIIGNSLSEGNSTVKVVASEY